MHEEQLLNYLMVLPYGTTISDNQIMHETRLVIYVHLANPKYTKELPDQRA
jgi:hypothetical protein